MALERFITPKAEMERREKIGLSLYAIYELLPQKDYGSANEYKSHTLAGRIREAAGQGDEPAQSVLRDFSELRYVEEVGVSLRKYSSKESSLRVATEQGSIVICYDHKKYKVKNTGAAYFGKVENPDGLFENLVKFVETDLSEGRKAWAEVLKARRNEYFQGTKGSEQEIRKKEIKAFIEEGNRGSEEIAVFGAGPKEEDGREVVEIFNAFEFSNKRAVENFTLNYSKVKGIEPRFYIDSQAGEIFEIEGNVALLRMRQLPGIDADGAWDLVEAGYAEFMMGNRDFKYELEGIGEVTLLGLDTGLNYPIFTEEKKD